MNFFFWLGNYGFPGSFGFVGELEILYTVFNVSFWLGLVLSIGMFLGVAYSMMTYSKVLGGFFVGTDLTAHEYLLFKVFVLGILYFGISV